MWVHFEGLHQYGFVSRELTPIWVCFQRTYTHMSPQRWDPVNHLEDCGLKSLIYCCDNTIMGLSSSFLACTKMGRLLKPQPTHPGKMFVNQRGERVLRAGFGENRAL